MLIEYEVFTFRERNVEFKPVSGRELLEAFLISVFNRWVRG